MDLTERAEVSVGQACTSRIPDFRVLTKGLSLQVDRQSKREAMRAKMLARSPRLMRRRGI
jgi:hypothetical protein